MRITLALLSLCAVLLAAGAARAQSVFCDGAGDFPCGYRISNVQIQPAPLLFNFQVRLSQAKLPLGDTILSRVVVKIKRGAETLCTEDFHNVRVSYSTINLVIGHNIDCDLNHVVATNEDLAFQACVGGTGNCLRPVAFGTVPYSLKSSYAALAQQAQVVDIADEANYAERFSADRDMLLRREIETGYFDMSTPASAPSLYANPTDFAPFANGGFLTWTPLHESAPTLHISARDAARDTPVPLDRLLLESNDTETLGNLVVKSNGMQVTGASSINSATTILGMLTVNSRSDGGLSGLKVQGTGTISGTLDVGGAATIASGGVHAVGDSDETGSLSVTGALTSGGPLTVSTSGGHITGDLTLSGDLNASGSVSAPAASFDDLTVGSTGATINGPITVTGQVSIPGGVSMSGVTGDFNVPGTLTAGALQVSGATTLASASLSGNLGSAGKDPNTGYPTGWTGGLHTQDVYAEGSIGVGPSGGPARAYIDSGGTIQAQKAVIANNLQVGTINGHAPGSGGSGMSVQWQSCQQGSSQCYCNNGGEAIAFAWSGPVYSGSDRGGDINTDYQIPSNGSAWQYQCGAYFPQGTWGYWNGAACSGPEIACLAGANVLPTCTLPSGTYSGACTNCSVSGSGCSLLSCQCADTYGSYHGTSLGLPCYADIADCNGNLTCGSCAPPPTCSAPSGTYSATCTGCSVSGCTLSCSCKDVNGVYHSASLALPCNSASNCNGSLVCGFC